ncbi:MAG: hypothetical protein ABFC73_05000, partial [Clostridiaceae bacterium]
TGLEGETYYVGLLERFSAAHNIPEEQTLADALKNGTAVGDETVLRQFAAYQNPEELVAQSAVQDCSETHLFKLDYFPSNDFKILLYFPSTGHFVVSDRFYTGLLISSSRQLDAARIGLNAQSNGAMNFHLGIQIHYGPVLLNFFTRLGLTILVEVVIALMFKFTEKRILRFILIVNIITQVLLMAVLSFVRFGGGRSYEFLMTMILETAVFIIEGILYGKYVNRFSTKPIRRSKPWVYSCVANTASFLFGLVLYNTYL